MDQVHVIRHKVLVEGRSCRQVAKEMGMSQNTVRKYATDGPETPTEPSYRGSGPRRRPVLEKVQARLDELLEDWSSRSTKKQRLTATAVHAQLLSEGFKVGETTVRAYVREWRRQRQEVHVPLVHRPGDEAQVDFFEVTVELNGVRCKRWMFLMRLMDSGRDFTWLYEHCDQVSFLDGHVRAFAHFGGVPKRCIYDNLKAAVKKVLHSGRELSGRFKALVSHYLFEPCFARVGEGHDKGGVESRGKNIRLQHLFPVPRGANLEGIAHELLDRLDRQAESKCDKDGATVLEKFLAEQQLFRPLPERPFEPRITIQLSVSRQSTVRCLGAIYSLPSHWHNLDATAYVGATDIRFICRDEVVVRERVAKNQANVQYRDYFAELRKKPQAVRQVAPELLNELGEPFTKLWHLLEQTHGGREAGRVLARILAAMLQHGEGTVADVPGHALAHGNDQISEILSVRPEAQPTQNDVPEPLQQYEIESARASDFDALIADAEVGA